jgi:hypothetical protein
VTKPLVESGEWLVAWRQRISTGQVFTVMSRTVTLFGVIREIRTRRRVDHSVGGLSRAEFAWRRRPTREQACPQMQPR